LAGQAPDLFAVLEPAGGILYASPATEELLGFAPDELMGADYTEFVHPDDGRQATEAIAPGSPGIRRIVRVRLRHKDRSWIEVDGWASVVVGADGKASMVVVSARAADVRARADSVLQERNRLTQAIFDGALDAMLIADDERVYVDANPAACALLGLSHQEIVGRRIEDFAEPETAALLMSGWPDFLAVGEQHGDHAGIAADGRRFAAEFKAVANVVPGLHLSVLREVTEEKRAQDELKVSEERHRVIVESSRDGIWILDGRGLTKFANAAMAEMLGRSIAELMGRPATDFVDPKLIPLVRENLGRRRAGVAERYELEFVKKDGSSLLAMLNCNPIYNADGSYRGVLAMITDIGEVKARTRQHQVVADLGRQALSDVSFDEFIGSAISAIAETLDVDFCTGLELLPDGELLVRASLGWTGKEVGTCLPAEHQAGFLLRSRERLLVIDDLASETRFESAPSFAAHGVTSSITCVIEYEDEQFGVVGAHTRRRRTFRPDELSFLESVTNLIAGVLRRERGATALRESEARFRLLADNAKDVVYRYRLGDNPGYEYLSPSASITGYSAEEFMADPRLADRITHPDYRNVLVENSLAQANTDTLLRMTHRDGSTIWFERRNRLVYDEHGVPVAVEGIGRDVTDQVEAESKRKTLEEQLIQSQKMEAVGRLAGGVAHDMNNLLTAISGYAELLARQGGLGDLDRRHVDEILHASGTAARLTQQLVAFGRQQVLQPELLDANGVVRAKEDELQRLLGDDIEIVTLLSPEIGAVRADRSQLELALMNLVRNAREAMPSGGTLTVATSPLVLDREFVAPNGVVDPGTYTQITVSDDGEGMTAETLEHAFDPFFTTNTVGDGSGLGLSTVYGIVAQTGGHVWAHSTPGQGTSITIVLPSLETPALQPAAPAEAAGGGETVLLVEDEEIVCMVVGEMLEEAGYSVVTARNGEEAVEAFADQGPFDAVLTDVVMPKMGGPALIQVLRQSDPSLRVIYASGYTDDAFLREGTLAKEPFLQKPFSRNELLLKLRELLDAPLALQPG
jgi:PAS domain S-box-containing protein